MSEDASGQDDGHPIGTRSAHRHLGFHPRYRADTTAAGLRSITFKPGVSLNRGSGLLRVAPRIVPSNSPIKKMRGVYAPTAAGDALRPHTQVIDGPRREPRISRARRGFGPLQNGANSLMKQPAASVVRQRGDAQRDHKQCQWRTASAATWDQPLQPEPLEVTLEAAEAPAGTISFGGAVINTLNIMVNKLPSHARAFLSAYGSSCGAACLGNLAQRSH